MSNPFFTQSIYNFKRANTNTPYNNLCNSICTLPNAFHIEYVPLKTTRYNSNLSQKMKFARFARRFKDHTVDHTEAIEYQFRNL
jgi:hypothetical protein